MPGFSAYLSPLFDLQPQQLQLEPECGMRTNSGTISDQITPIGADGQVAPSMIVTLLRAIARTIPSATSGNNHELLPRRGGWSEP
jgi:hypothetical protein